MSAISLVGTDTEVFLRHKQTGEFISSVGLIGGTKHDPMPIGEGCFLQEDNVTVEFNTPACSMVEHFIDTITYNLNNIKERAEKLGLSLAIVPSGQFSKKELNSRAAQTFGCEPDFNAWMDGAKNPKPKCKDASLRSAGGHIHVSTELDILTVVRAMDLFISCPMVEWDTDVGRRQLYGKAGAFRPKPYGVEYRTPSNAWIQSEEKIRWVWAQIDKSLKFAEVGGADILEYHKEKIQDCINNSDLNILNGMIKPIIAKTERDFEL